MTFWRRITAVALFTVLTGLASSPARAQDNVTCDPLTHGLEFCWSLTAFVPLPDAQTQYTNEGGGDGSETLLYFQIYNTPEAGTSYDAVFNAILAQDADFFGVTPSDYKLIDTYDTEIAGQPAKQRYYHLPAGISDTLSVSTVQSRAVAITEEFIFVAFTMEQAKVPGFSHIGDSMIAFAAIQQEGGALTDPPKGAETAAPPPSDSYDCDALGKGVALCGVADLGLDKYEVMENGVIAIANGDTAANLFVNPHDGYTPPITEAQRFDLQRSLHRNIVQSWLDSEGVAPSDVAVGYSLKVAVGAAENAPNALFETFSYETSAGADETWGITVHLGPDYYLVMVGGNPGGETSEDHFFLVEEVMRGIRLPGQPQGDDG